MKEKILLSIYDSFQKWAENKDVACHKGCATCCTQNVTVTATEAELIHKYFLAQNKQDYLAKILATAREYVPLNMTTNDFAEACLNGKEVSPESDGSLAPCLFLENNICQIYEVRPFACRAFCSSSPCKEQGAAIITEAHTASLTAVYQIVEHLGQREYWGNLYDVLIAMTDISAYKESAISLAAGEEFAARKRLLVAKPLAGFLLSESDMQEAEPLLNEIFSATVDGKTIEAILNGQ